MTYTKQTTRTRSLNVKTSVKAGPFLCPDCRGDLINKTNHNQTQADCRSAQRTRGFNVKSGVKAGPHLKMGDRYFFTIN